MVKRALCRLFTGHQYRFHGFSVGVDLETDHGTWTATGEHRCWCGAYGFYEGGPKEVACPPHGLFVSEQSSPQLRRAFSEPTQLRSVSDEEAAANG